VFLYVLHVFVALGDCVDLDIGYTGGLDGDDAKAGPRQLVSRQPSTEVVDWDNDPIIQCLEHMSARLIAPICIVFVVFSRILTILLFGGSFFDDDACT
jgi:hypothetical protein